MAETETTTVHRAVAVSSKGAVYRHVAAATRALPDEGLTEQEILPAEVVHPNRRVLAVEPEYDAAGNLVHRDVAVVTRGEPIPDPIVQPAKVVYDGFNGTLGQDLVSAPALTPAQVGGEALTPVISTETLKEN